MCIVQYCKGRIIITQKSWFKKKNVILLIFCPLLYKEVEILKKKLVILSETMSPKIRSKLYSSYSEKVLKIFIEYLILVSSMSVVVSLDLFSSVMILVISYVLGITYILTHLFYKEKPSFHWIFLLFSVFFLKKTLCEKVAYV